jgi:hypothetical protein
MRSLRRRPRPLHHEHHEEEGISTPRIIRRVIASSPSVSPYPTRSQVDEIVVAIAGF